MRTLDGKVAVVTGATSGIGARAAEMFATEGATVVLAGRRQDEGERWAAKLGPSALFVRCDVTVESDVEAMLNRAVKEFGRLDVLINNAGHGGVAPGEIQAVDLGTFERLLAVHAGGVLAGMKHAARIMVPQGSGSIVNIASIGGQVAGWTDILYSAAKAAVLQLTRSAAIELGLHGIRVNSISPGPIPTGIFGKAAGLPAADADRTAEQLEPAFVTALQNHQAIRRAGRPDDVAGAALWLASDASTFVNGQDITVDGGITAGRPISVSAGERELLATAFASLR
jgi:NAD(P)-dependent dehydrogenase (short-subunit alcohol dehydrogenase family)